MSKTAKRSFVCHLVFSFALLSAPLCIAAAEGMWDSVFAYQQKMADYGQPEAQLKLGEMYEDGLGTSQNFDRAKQWYQKALDQGFSPAQEKLNNLQQRRQQAADAVIERERRLLTEKAELKRLAQEQVAREKAEKELAEKEKAERDRAEKELLARESELGLERERTRQQEEDKVQAAEEERLARKRAQEVIKKLLAVPSGYDY